MLINVSILDSTLLHKVEKNLNGLRASVPFCASVILGAMLMG